MGPSLECPSQTESGPSGCPSSIGARDEESASAVRIPPSGSPPSGPPPPLTPSLQATAPTRAVTIAAAAQRPALLMSVVVRPACMPETRPARLPGSNAAQGGVPRRAREALSGQTLFTGESAGTTQGRLISTFGHAPVGSHRAVELPAHLRPADGAGGGAVRRPHRTGGGGHPQRARRGGKAARPGVAGPPGHPRHPVPAGAGGEHRHPDRRGAPGHRSLGALALGRRLPPLARRAPVAGHRPGGGAHPAPEPARVPSRAAELPERARSDRAGADRGPPDAGRRPGSRAHPRRARAAARPER